MSTRDVDAALMDALGPDAAVSRLTASRICGDNKEQQCEAGRNRP